MSPRHCDGTIENISTWREVIFGSPRLRRDRRPYNGTVVDAIRMKDAYSKPGSPFRALAGGETGQLYGYIAQAILTPDLITDEMANKLVVGGAYLPAETVARNQVGVAGI